MKVHGFTLIELMVTLIIIGLIAMIAIPTYRNYVIQAALSDGTSNLANYRVILEQYYQDNGNYGINNACGVATPGTRYFNYACAIQNAGQNYTVTATGNGTGGVTNAYQYTINDQNVQRTTAFPGGTVPAACWLTQAGGC